MNPDDPLLRSLQLTVQARSFFREHRQLFGWICIGLLCTGKQDPPCPVQETVTSLVVSASQSRLIRPANQ